VGTIRGFSVDELDPNRKRSWWERLFGRAKPLHDFIAKFEDVQDQIDKITDNLLSHEHTLMKDIKSLDKLYEKTLDFYDELALYIAAGEAKLEELDTQTIPAKEAEVHAAPEDGQVIKAQELRDLRAARDDLERRVHDLKLTRQVTMQSLPSIRLVQENDKSARDQDQLDPRQHRAAVGNPAGAGGDDPALDRGRQGREGGHGPDQRAAQRTPRTCANRTAWSARRWSAACSTSRP
jgi:hypothetical protein